MSPATFRALAARLDGAAMLALAGFLGWLVLFGDYWMYLNPRFKPVTLAAAAVLAVLGGYAALRPVSRPRLGRGLCYLALAAMIAAVQGGVQAVSRQVDSDPFFVEPTLPAPERSPAPAGRMQAGGREYIPINAGELFDVAAKGTAEAFARPYVMRGFVHRSPELDARGQFVLYRLAVWCCFADGTAVGFKVQAPAGAPLPADKAWLAAYGRLAALPEDQRREYVLPGMAFSSVAPGAVLAAEHLEPLTLVPEDAYMFEWRQAEPYAY